MFTFVLNMECETAILSDKYVQLELHQFLGANLFCKVLALIFPFSTVKKL